jgi:putative endonuclease
MGKDIGLGFVVKHHLHSGESRNPAGMGTGVKRLTPKKRVLKFISNYFVYILASKRNGTLYVGFTGNLLQRVYAHRNGMVDSFTKKYCVYMLVYYETGNDYNGTLQREKQIKEWHRKWKIELIEKHNPKWRDLYEDIV